MALVLAITTAVVFVPRPAAADQISDLNARAVSVSQQMIHQQLQVGTYQQQYAVASATVQHDAQVINETGIQVGHDQQQINTDRKRIEAQAITLYMNAGSDASGQLVSEFDTNADTSLVRSVYRGIAVGNITTTLDRLHADQGTLQAHQAALQQQQAQDQGAQAHVATALENATSAQRQLEAEQAQVTGQLAVAVGQQAAAQAAAAAAAVKAAQDAATTKAEAALKATYVTTPAASAATATNVSSSGGGGVDPALNSFLQCVVQRESRGDYGAVSPGGQYMGAFQFSQSTWNVAAQAAGRPDLVGVPPNLASKPDQDTVAVALYSLEGGQPWGGSCS